MTEPCNCEQSLALQAELDKYKQDMEYAAGECLVPLPEPGTFMAKLLSANILLRRRLAEGTCERCEDSVVLSNAKYNLLSQKAALYDLYKTFQRQLEMVLNAEAKIKVSSGNSVSGE